MAEQKKKWVVLGVITLIVAFLYTKVAAQNGGFTKIADDKLDPSLQKIYQTFKEKNWSVDTSPSHLQGQYVVSRFKFLDKEIPIQLNSNKTLLIVTDPLKPYTGTWDESGKIVIKNFGELNEGDIVQSLGAFLTQVL
jgi:hypothetical protein